MLAVLFVSRCSKKKGNTIDNPYNKTVNNNPPSTTDSTVSDTSIQGLHKNIFKPTCANSGCHDGTFEPDFRTVQSSYASLVNVPPIKNDSAGTFAARVVPGNADASMIIYRLTVDLGGNSGIMPLVVNPGNDYPDKKTKYISDIKAWINNGARDMNGNAPKPVDFPPQIMGVVGMVGTSILPRGGRYEPIYAATGSSIQLWFSLTDDKVAQNSLTGMKINWSTDPTNYNAANAKNLVQATSKVMPGLYSSTADYSWYYTFDASGYNSGDVIWFRITCSDGTNMNYELPNDNSMFFLKKYFAVKIQ